MGIANGIGTIALGAATAYGMSQLLTSIVILQGSFATLNASTEELTLRLENSIVQIRSLQLNLKLLQDKCRFLCGTSFDSNLTVFGAIFSSGSDHSYFKTVECQNLIVQTTTLSDVASAVINGSLQINGITQINGYTMTGDLIQF